MEYLQETTDWSVVGNVFPNIPNHIYILNQKKELVGYIKEGTTEEMWFKSPMKQFSKSRRTFRKVKV